MTHAVAKRARPPVGTLAWLDRTGGRLDFVDRLAVVAGGFSAVREGFRLGRAARRSPRRDVPLARIEPPDTPIVGAAKAYLLAHASPAMANHAIRTAFWTLTVLHQHGAPDEGDLETAWVAALLHDVGLELPPAAGDFSLAGVEALRALAREHGWGQARTERAAEAIAVNLSTRVDRARCGDVAWAMNVGGAGEVGSFLHRAQMHPDRLRELEQRYPRTGFREAALRLIAEEARRVPRGRFAFVRHVFPLVLRG